MSIYQFIDRLKANPPQTEKAAMLFLANLDDSQAQQLMAAIYIGREHIHHNQLRTDMSISRSFIEHLSLDDYPRIIHEKSDNVVTYLDKLLACAKASNFDLNKL